MYFKYFDKGKHNKNENASNAVPRNLIFPDPEFPILSVWKKSTLMKPQFNISQLFEILLRTRPTLPTHLRLNTIILDLAWIKFEAKKEKRKKKRLLWDKSIKLRNYTAKSENIKQTKVWCAANKDAESEWATASLSGYDWLPAKATWPMKDC